MEDPEVTECIKTGVDEAKSNDDKGRCRELLCEQGVWGFLSTLRSLKTPLRRSVGEKRALVHFC